MRSTKVLSAYPDVRGGLVELPKVIEAATAYISNKNIALYPQDLFSPQSLPSGYNLHFYCNTIHIFSTPQAQILAKKSFDALPSGGRLVLCEILLNEDRTGPLEACLFNMHMFMCLEHGRQFTPSQITEFLLSAGFINVSIVYLFGAFSLIQATKP